MRILSLDAYLNAPNIENRAFGDRDTAFEYDVVFWDPGNTLGEYELTSEYKGHPRVSDRDSTAIQRDIARRRNEFSELLEMGRTLVVFVASEQNFWFDSGGREKSGTGKNQKVTTLLDSMELMEEVVPKEFKVSTGEGRRMAARESGFRSLVSANADRWWYRAILEEFPGNPLAVVVGTNKCVGSVYRNEKGGMLLLLPDFLGPDFPDSEGDVDDIASAGKSDSVGGLEVEASEVLVDDSFDQPTIELILWVESLRSESDEPPPAWLHRYQFPEDAAVAQKVEELEMKASEISSEIASLKSQTESSDRWKRLLYSTGDELEAQVIEAFRFLGFDAEKGPEGRADVVLRLGDSRAVSEVKGLSGSAAEKNAAQLEKWLSEEMLSGFGKVKGILVVNSHRHLPPEVRNGRPFPHQMVGFSTPREHCLVTTCQLLAMVRAVMGDPSLAPSIAEELLATTGTVAGWDGVLALFREH
ncbi:hypothetical protein [Streptomyces goshikiensis]|uniref:hypothetical protein n=1 Tax=Streptomyces goshikiensis TaxID=1942 RepID=UPI002E137FEF|nr:hypothetical protein OG224_16900 [Streptomyces goshikiensis]